MTIPQHIAIIMDGNGRWANQRFLPRLAGHRAGVESAREVVKLCLQKKIRVLSLFAFSSENWQRPVAEVSHLMTLFMSGLEKEMMSLHENNVQLRFIGDRRRFSDKLRNKITEVEQLMSKNTGMVLIIAADYGGRWDMWQAAHKAAQEVEAGRLSSSAITPEWIASQLSFADLPDPDLFIRTSGEQRISNFMLWQLAYTELYFSDVFWPDFNKTELEKALTFFRLRERRFGQVTCLDDELSQL